MYASDPATASVDDGRDGGSTAEDYEAPAGAAGGQYGTGESIMTPTAHTHWPSSF